MLMMAAQCEMACGRFESVRAFAENGRKLAPDQKQWYLLLSQTEAMTGEPDKAVEWMRLGITHVAKGKHELLAQLTNMLLDRGKVSEARGVLEELQHFDAAQDWLEYLTGRILLSEREWLSASKQFEAARPYFLDHPSLRGNYRRMYFSI
jgi:uncharacterized protein HemY